MTARTMPPANDPWCNAEGTEVGLFCWVEQVIESPEVGMLPSRLHQQGQVVGRGFDAFYVRFADNQVVSVSPNLLRIISDCACDEQLDG